MTGKIKNAVTAPKQAVTAAGLGGAIGILVVWGFNLAGVDVPGEAGAAIGTVSTFIVQRFVAE